MTLKTCAIYCRVSTDKQRERHTIASQISLLPDLVKKHGLTIYKEYVDDGISGESIDGRPAFCRLLDDASAGKFSAVAVIDFDRLTRATDLTQLALIKKIFRDNHIAVITPSQVFDFHDEEHDFLSDLFGILAKHEKRKILARTRRGMKEKMRQGKWIAGSIPTPYYKKDGKVLIDPAEKKLVLAILKDAKSMGRRLISQKYALGQGKLQKMLSMKRLHFYSGYLEVDGQKVRGLWEPIITLEDVDELMRHTEARRDRKEYSKATYLLTGMGILKCGTCGRAVASNTHTTFRPDIYGSKPRLYRRGYYRCNNRRCVLRPKVWPEDLLNGKVLFRVEHHLQRLDLIMSYTKEAAARGKKGGEIDVIAKRIQEEETKRRNLIRAISGDVIRLDEAAEELQAIRNNLEALNQSSSELSKTSKPLALAELQTLQQISIYDLPLQDQRKVIQIFIGKLNLNRANLHIHYLYSLTAAGKNTERIPLKK